MTFTACSFILDMVFGGVMEITAIDIKKDPDQNVIVGQAHFIKTVEDLYEALSQSSASGRFGIAFCEASGPRLIRTDGNDGRLIGLAADNAASIACGHVFIIMMEDMYPLNCLNAVKSVPEVCSVFVATANTLKLVVAEEDGSRGVIGVLDGGMPAGTETEKEKCERHALLRDIGYKR